jgi:AcrR family transcriptional regulator
VGTRLSSEERREHLLHVGVELVGRHGTADVSIEEIARAAGVSKGLLYHYFPTKTDFFVAVLARSQAEMDQAVLRDPELTALEQFDRNLDGFLDFVEELVEERRRRRVDELVALAAVREDVPRDVARTPLLVAAIEGWIGFTEGVIVRWLRDRELSKEEVHDLLRTTFLAALPATAASNSGVSRSST